MEENLSDRSGETVEKFVLERLLGEGGMGQVYLAQHQITDRWVAVKILHQEFAQNNEILARIRREAKAAALIGHPNIVEIIDSGTDQYGAPFIAMELLEGESLDDFLERMGPMPVPLACHIIADICDTLTAAHAKGVVHRDMKPENVFMQKRHKTVVPQVKILDFGISKFLTMDQQDMSLTKTGTVMGTPYYMSVEQAMGQKVDGRADIYSVGVILYQLLTARLPYYDTNYNRVLLQIVAGEHVPVIDIRPDLPQELSDIIQLAMTKNRDERYADCAQFRAALLPYVENYNLDELFGANAADGNFATNDIPLLTPTPQMADASVIRATLQSTKPVLSSTDTTGEVLDAPPARSKGIFVAIAGVVVLAALGLYFLFGRGKSTDNSKDPAVVMANSTNNTMLPDMPVEMLPDMPVVKIPDMPVEMLPDMPVVKIPSKVFLTIQNIPTGAVVKYNKKVLTSPYTVAGAATKQEITILKRGYMPFTTSFTPDKQNVVVVYKGTRYSRHNTRPMDMRKPMVVPMVIMTVKVVKPMVMKPVNTNSNPDKPDF